LPKGLLKSFLRKISMSYNRHEPRENTKVFITIEGHDIYGHQKLEALMTDVSYSGICLYSPFPFELNSIVEIYIGGELAAKGEIADVITSDTEQNPAIKTRIGVQIIYKYKAWPYLREDIKCTDSYDAERR
jgi:PilZ domain